MVLTSDSSDLEISSAESRGGVRPLSVLTFDRTAPVVRPLSADPLDGGEVAGNLERSQGEKTTPRDKVALQPQSPATPLPHSRRIVVPTTDRSCSGAEREVGRGCFDVGMLGEERPSPRPRASKGNWTAHEDKVLADAVNLNDGKNWKRISEKLEGR